MSGPLQGVVVLDLTRFLAGPYCTMILSDLGAEVLKVEPPEGDESRWQQNYRYQDETAYFISVNRNKKGLVLDLKTDAGRRVFYDLARTADVVVDNYRPGVLERLKIDYRTLSALNPRIICCSISGFGDSGPHSRQPAYDLIIQAMGGGMSITGEPGRPPARMGMPIGDLAGGLFAVGGILAALYERERSGRGQQVTTSLLASQVALLTYVAGFYWHTPEEPGPMGNAHKSLVPYQAFQASDGRWLVIVAHTPKFFPKLCRAVDRPDLIEDQRFRTLESRLQHREELVRILTEAFSRRPRDQWLEILREHDVPSGPVNSVGEALSDPGVLAQDMVVELLHSKGFPVKVTGNPLKFSRTGRTTFSSPPSLGEHTEEVLRQRLGYTDHQIEALRADGAFGHRREQSLT